MRCMGSKETERVGWIGWTTFVIGILAMGISMQLGDMVFICLKYGQRAYFTEGLRFVKHKPYTLSNGVVLTQDAGTLPWLASVVIWLGFIVGTAALLAGGARLFRRFRVRSQTR